MFSAFFAIAARSPSRQKTFRRAVTAHVGFVAAVAAVLGLSPAGGTPTTLFGQLLLVAGVVEGALLIGWRLTQLPKSQALEFLLVSPLRPCWVLVAEGLVGLSFLGLVTLAGLPVLALLNVAGLLGPLDVAIMLAMPFTWGAVTGLVLAVWAFEPASVRRWGERVMVVLVLLYLVVGVLAGERLAFWLQQLPGAIGDPLLVGLVALRDYNPFGMMRVWTEKGPERAWDAAVGVEAGALLLIVLLMARAARRLGPDFHERHYRPAVVRAGRSRGTIGERPLTWWAVRRVSEYAGRINLWLAGGFCVLYALYTVAGPQWPQWMGRSVFVLCDRLAGIEGLATALVLLAAVPAAFQYGLWDASTQDRCRRLELLLLTRLDARDYWNAAAAAAWRRGRGYFSVAVVLWDAAVLAGQTTPSRVIAAASAGVLLWGLYFALGFVAFSRGVQANGLGTLLTLGLPLAAVGLWRLGEPALAALTPPGSVYAGMRPPSGLWFVGPVLAGVAALAVGRRALFTCDPQLRRWYDRNHGQKVMS